MKLNKTTACGWTPCEVSELIEIAAGRPPVPVSEGTMRWHAFMALGFSDCTAIYLAVFGTLNPPGWW